MLHYIKAYYNHLKDTLLLKRRLKGVAYSTFGQVRNKDGKKIEFLLMNPVDFYKEEKLRLEFIQLAKDKKNSKLAKVISTVQVNRS